MKSIIREEVRSLNAYKPGKPPEEILACSPKFSDIGMNEMGLLVMDTRLTDGTVIPVHFSIRYPWISTATL